MFHRLFAEVLAGLSLLTCGAWATPASPANPDTGGPGDGRSA